MSNREKARERAGARDLLLESKRQRARARQLEPESKTGARRTYRERRRTDKTKGKQTESNFCGSVVDT